MVKNNKIKQRSQSLIWFSILILAFFAGFAYTQLQTAKISSHPFIKINLPHITVRPLPTPTIIVKKKLIRGINTISPTPYPKIVKKVVPDTANWGVAQKIGEHTYTIKLGSDERMGTPNEILSALNIYRQTQGKGTLQWDDKLGNYAQQRANTFKSISTTDEHKGLNDFLDHEDGFVKLGYNRIGENSYYGEPLFGVHVIEWLFASSAEHNANQLDGDWNYAGIGVTDSSVDVIFGGGRM